MSKVQVNKNYIVILSYSMGYVNSGSEINRCEFVKLKSKAIEHCAFKL